MAASSSNPKVEAPPDEDEEVLRIPIFLRPEDAREPVCLFQYPLRPRWRPYNLDELKTARVRPVQRRVELGLGSECGPSNYDVESQSPMTNVVLASTNVTTRDSYAVAMVRYDEGTGEPSALCLTPLSSIVQLRPSFAAIDQAEAEGAAAAAAAGRAAPRGAGGAADDELDEGEEGDGEEAASEDEDEGAASAIAPIFRPPQTEREIQARRTSHAYLVEQRDAEPWSKAMMYPADSAGSAAVRERCFEPPR